MELPRRDLVFTGFRVPAPPANFDSTSSSKDPRCSSHVGFEFLQLPESPNPEP